MSWSWKTKPRSIIRTVQWFPCFARLEGENWNQKSDSVSRRDGKAVHPIRRTYIYDAHRDEDSWLSTVSAREYLSGKKDLKETEANGRMDKGAFEFFGFGYVKTSGEIAVTEMGRRIVQKLFDDEDYLKQLLKLRLPNYTYEPWEMKKGHFVFPFQLVLKAFREFESLNRSELALLFGCDDSGQTDSAIKAIRCFKEAYAELENKNDTEKVKKLFAKVYKAHYGAMQNQADSYYEYAEAFSRSLVYTGLFSVSGRSIASKLRVAVHSAEKVKMLQEKYIFSWPRTFADLDDYMAWFGSCAGVSLPWEKPNERRIIILSKARLLLEQEQKEGAGLSRERIREIIDLASSTEKVEELKDYETILSNAIASRNEEYFIRVQSKTGEERQAILDRFSNILDNDDMSALWLEVNTWKSLIAVNGRHKVKRNFRIEEDLTPKSFAPGVGNTPDMEVYGDNFVIVPEVSLMTGVRQWEHEGSSVIDHVLEFIREYGNRRVLGLFLSSRIHHRTMWQFFVLNRESWMGAPVPVIPLTIKQYKAVLSYLYRKEGSMEDLEKLLEKMTEKAYQCGNYQEWEKCIDACIPEWMEETDRMRREKGSMRAREERLAPLLKYPGGKEKELKYILPSLPQGCRDYYEPFVGGGAVYFAIWAGRSFINDKSTELASLYRMVQEQNPEFLRKAWEMEHCWETLSRVTADCMEELTGIYTNCRKKSAKTLGRLADEFLKRRGTEFEAVMKTCFLQKIEEFVPQLGKSLKDKMERMRKLEKQRGKLSGEDLVLNLEGAVKNAAYIHFRSLYNRIGELKIGQPHATALYFFIREYCYSSMFRYNRDGKFNVPYGGISYNKKFMTKKIQYFQEKELAEHLAGTVVENLDFEEFFRIHEPGEEDFVFLDPPYDSEFSTYAGNEFDRRDQERLADFLLNRCRARFMLVIKNTDFIRSLYPEGKKTAGGRKLYVGMFDKKYVVSFRDRNDKSAQHLMITNYPLPYENIS